MSKQKEKPLEDSKIKPLAGFDNAPKGKTAKEANVWNRIWLYVTAAFVVLCLFSLINELLDLPHNLIGIPETRTNWAEVAIESTAIVIVGFFSVSVLISAVNARKRVEKSVLAERDKAQKYLDIAGVIIVVLNAEGTVVLINKKGCDVLDYEQTEIVGKNWFETFLPRRDKDRVKGVFDKLIVGEIEPFEHYENAVLTQSGDERLIAWHNSILRDKEGRITHTISSGEDITERKQTEEKLLDYQAQLKSLASQLTLAEEHERRRIAAELHDRISQSLVISKMKVEKLHKSSSSKEIKKTLNEIANSLGCTIAEAKSLIHRIHPPLLPVLGFEAALAEWLNEQIQENHGIEIEFLNDKKPKPLDEDISILLFRNVRELLINVVKHAKAQKAKVSIRKVDDKISVTVEDDGAGFDPDMVARNAAKKGAFGLFSIQEQLEKAGGHLEIESKPGHGTKVTIIAPLKCRNFIEGRKT